MKKLRNNQKSVNKALHILALLTCVLPPAICTAMYFPLWQSGGAEVVLAGGGVLILTLCAVPLFKAIRRLMSSPASYVMWLAAFILFFCLSKIAEQMTVISFVGFVSNLLGALMFRIARRGEAENEE